LFSQLVSQKETHFKLSKKFSQIHSWSHLDHYLGEKTRKPLLGFRLIELPSFNSKWNPVRIQQISARIPYLKKCGFSKIFWPANLFILRTAFIFTPLILYNEKHQNA